MRLIMTEDGGRVLVIAGVATLDDYAREARQLATIMVSVGFEALRGPTMGVGNE